MSKYVERGEKIREDLEELWVEAREAREYGVSRAAREAWREIQRTDFYVGNELSEEEVDDREDEDA